MPTSTPASLSPPPGDVALEAPLKPAERERRRSPSRPRQPPATGPRRLEGHGEPGGTAARSLGHPGSQPDRGEGGLDSETYGWFLRITCRTLLRTEPRQRRLFPSCSAHANLTASQSVRHPAVIWVRPRISLTPAAALSCAPEIIDTEEVTGSNPVSPTSNTPSQRPVCDLATRFWRLVRLTRRPNCRPCAVLARRTGSAGVHLHGYSRRAVRPRCSSRCPVPRARVALTGT